jgi:hypothetical protein
MWAADECGIHRYGDGGAGCEPFGYFPTTCAVSPWFPRPGLRARPPAGARLAAVPGRTGVMAPAWGTRRARREGSG